MTEHANPMVPMSIGALLAEEWTIDPYSVLPSFLEMFMMQEASRSARKALTTAIDVVQRQLDQSSDSQATSEQSLVSSRLQSFSKWVHQKRTSIARTLARLLLRYGPELRCLAIYLMERQCLYSKASATVSESIYGARRAKLQQSNYGNAANPHRRKLTTLSNTDKTRLALLLALGPYLREKFEALYQDCLQNQGSKGRRIFAFAYPFFRMTCNGTQLWTQWQFLLNRSVHFDLFSMLLNQVVRRVTQEDMEPSHEPPRDLTRSDTTSASQTTFKPTTLPSPRKVALLVLSTSIALSWLTQLRLEWQQYRDERRRQAASGEDAAVIPPPPSCSGASVTTAPDQCPLCRNIRVNPTASSSGYVFCLACLLPYVKKHGKCPVTGMKCPEDRIIRLHEPRHDL